MSKRKILPTRGGIYTADQIMNVLELRDAPHMYFTHEGRRSVVQNSHLTDAELLSVPGFADTKWTYLRTTDEWIPVFSAISDSAIRECVDIEPWIDPYSDDAGFWVTPKGFPRQQYYKVNADGDIVRYDDEEVNRLDNQRLK